MMKICRRVQWRYKGLAAGDVAPGLLDDPQAHQPLAERVAGRHSEIAV